MRKARTGLQASRCCIAGVMRFDAASTHATLKSRASCATLRATPRWCANTAAVMPNRDVEPQGPASDRLDSWKEIAAYLKRAVITVQRWEKHEGLPVHRHLHGKLGSVWANRGEVDAWWQSRRLDLEHEKETPSPEAHAEFVPDKRNSWRRKLLLAGAAAAILFQ